MADNPLTYAVPDLHGRYDLFQLAMAAIRARGGKKIVFLGDYIDRGPQSKEIVTTLIEGPPEGETWICLAGNHEKMMVDSLRKKFASIWISNGGRATLNSYDNKVPISHAEWMDKLPLYHEAEHHLFSHAGGDETKPISEQGEQQFTWTRVPMNYNYSIEGKHVVHGHTPYTDGPMLMQNRTNLDTYAFDTGVLHVGVFDESVNCGPIDIIEVIGEPARK